MLKLILITKLYNEKLIAFNKQILYKNTKILEYKNKISILKAKINELHEELNLLKGNSSVNNTSFFNASFINNSIINTNTSQKPNDKLSNNSVILNKNYSSTNNRIDMKSNIINPTKKNSALNPYTIYNSKTVDRKDIKENNNNKLNNLIGVNNSKDDSNIMKDSINHVKNEINITQIKKEILMPQTPQISKDDFVPIVNTEKIEVNKNLNLQEFINKNKEEDKNRINFVKEYKEILDKFGSNLNQNINNNN